MSYKKIILPIAIGIPSLLISFGGFYFFYTPDYGSVVQTKLLTTLNGEELDDSYWEARFRNNFESAENTKWSLDWYIPTGVIAWTSSSSPWYSRNAQSWDFFYPAFDEDYLALPARTGDKLLIYMFRYDGSQWILDQTIDEGFQYQGDLKLDEDVFTISNYTGVHIFRRTNTGWILEQTVEERSGPLPSLRLDKDVLAAAYNANIKVFRHNQDQWSEELEISEESFPEINLTDGYEMFLDGNELVILNGSGIYSFSHAQGEWVLEHKQALNSIAGLPAGITDTRHITASVHGDTMVLGQSSRNVVYVLERADGQWSLAEEISERTFPELNLDYQYNDPTFGYNVAIRENTLAVAEHVDSIYIFTRTSADNPWILEHKTPDGNNRFGQPIITDGNTVLIIESNALFALERNP